MFVFDTNITNAMPEKVYFTCSANGGIKCIKYCLSSPVYTIAGMKLFPQLLPFIHRMHVGHE